MSAAVSTTMPAVRQIAAAVNNRTRRIGILHPLAGPPDRLPSVAALLEGLRELSLEPGKSIEIGFGWGESKPELLATRAQQLVAGGVDVLVGGAAPGFAAATRATTTIPIVMAATSFDPVRSRAPDNVCGTSLFVPGIPPARLQLLKEFSTRISKVGIIFNPSNPQWESLVAEYETASQSLGLTAERVPAGTVHELEESINKALGNGVDALVAVQGADIFRIRKDIARAALSAKLPAITGEEDFAESGGLAKLAPNIPRAWRRAAWYVDQILKGARPSVLGVEVPPKSELIVNRSTARALGLEVPPAVAARADRLVD